MTCLHVDLLSQVIQIFPLLKGELEFHSIEADWCSSPTAFEVCLMNCTSIKKQTHTCDQVRNNLQLFRQLVSQLLTNTVDTISFNSGYPVQTYLIFFNHWNWR